ncbi:MAG: NRDE family protein, partial [Proteobacteria bacterium]|nr:NRDE family protein [Pseudomonadota bacterium]
GKDSPADYLNRIKSVSHQYNGFNLLIGDKSDLFYYSNKADGIQKLTPGLYGLCNHLINTPWPKVEKGKAALESLLDQNKEIDLEDVFKILGDRTYPPDDMLPDTGVGLSWERVLSPLFITSKYYGTRSSSVVLIERSGRTTFAERTFGPEADASLAGETRKFIFMISNGSGP